jgi:perosamine synthetase
MIPHNRPTLGLEEQQAAQRVIASGWIAQGREVEAFENEVCAFLGLPDGYAVAVSSGTAALYVALHALDVAGTRVGCPVYACSALTNALALAGATPVLIDTAADRPNIDTAALLGSKVETAIIPHIFGLPIDIAKIEGIRIIEDAAQAFGAAVRGTRVGLQGDIGIFSFYATKIITSGGQGGMVVSRDPDLIGAVRDYRAFDGRHDREPRFNLQMTDIQAAIGRVQLGKCDGFLRRRQEIFARYQKAGFPLVDERAESIRSARYRSVIRSLQPRELIDRLARRGVRAIVPVEDWELLGPPEQFPNAARFTRSTVSLPTYPSLSREEQDLVIDRLMPVMEDERWLA